jgi:hypothetical protein
MRRYFTQPVIKILAAAAVLLGFILYVAFAPRVPPPDEKNRATNLVGGYSIIRPPDWEEKAVYAAADRTYKDMLEIRPKVSRSGKETRIFIGRFRNPPDLEDIRQRNERVDTKFKNYEAEIFTGHTKHEREFFWRAIIHHGGEWYELTLWLPARQDVPTSEWWPYLQSFRAPDVPPTMPATQFNPGSP